MSARPNPVAYLADMIGQASARPRRAAMVWAYFDETVVQRKVEGPNGRFRLVPDQLLVGGCISSLDKWKAFEPEWQRALADEKISSFHSTDFYAFQKEFAWFTPQGEKDLPRHGAFRDRLADLIVEYVDE